MARYQDLSDFESGIIIGAREMGHSISEVAIRYILPDHLHSFMSFVHSDGLVQFQQDNATPHASRVAGSRNTLLTLDTSIGHLNPQR
ncbi:hypothetical protein AVEN_169152-1 [Araneus ventricosus]|uniref:Tc3 transposase DNA binding domain-containing protein n=1 Tax=Araneus ventricosus TaxID=182803 RepID=A0A4Y2C2V8_ARAVE|nr:hypothetical protein AVEN_169152-1 [Araneus ventricosus]